MKHSHLTALVRQGLAALEQEKTGDAISHFQEAARWRPTATVLSCLGYCLAREQRDLKKARALCDEAIRLEPANPLHYLNLGRVCLLNEQKMLAVVAFQRGLQFGRHPGLLREMKKLGKRRIPLFFSLGRKHFFNRFYGLILSCLGF